MTQSEDVNVLTEAVRQVARDLNTRASGAPIGSQERRDLLMKANGAFMALDAITGFDVSRPMAEQSSRVALQPSETALGSPSPTKVEQ